MKSIGRWIVALVRWSGWRDLLARLPLPMLALAASYGVYSFALLFVPPWVAIVQALAFELVYIGLAAAKLDHERAKRARAISVGAVLVSVVYNSLDGLLVRRPQLLELPPLWADVVLSLLHGVPLAVLAYLVADLLLHVAPKIQPPERIPEIFDRSTAPLAPLLAAPLPPAGRPQVWTLDTLMQAVGREFARSEVLDRLGASESAVDRLLAEGIETGRVERLERGRYRRVDTRTTVAQ